MRKHIIWILGILIMMNSCNNERKRPDISGINVAVKIDRFDKDIFSRNLDSLPSQIAFLRQQYGEFFDIFNFKIIQIGGDKEPGYPKLLKTYLTDFSVNQWYSKCNLVFPDLHFLESGLTEAFRYYKFYFPDKSGCIMQPSI